MKAIYLITLSFFLLGCEISMPPAPEPEPIVIIKEDPDKQVALDYMGPGSSILPGHFVVKGVDGSTYLCIVDPEDKTVRSLLLYIP